MYHWSHRNDKSQNMHVRSETFWFSAKFYASANLEIYEPLRLRQYEDSYHDYKF